MFEKAVFILWWNFFPALFSDNFYLFILPSNLFLRFYMARYVRSRRSFGRRRKYSGRRRGGYSSRKRRSFGRRRSGVSRSEVKVSPGLLTYNYTTWSIANNVQWIFANIVAVPTQIATTVSNPYLLTGVAQGTDGNMRVGLSINPKSLMVRGSATAARSSTPTDSEAQQTAKTAPVYIRTTFRMIFFKSMEPGSEPGHVYWNDLIQSDNSFMNIFGFSNLQNTGRYVIVKDVQFTIDNDTPQKDFNLAIPISPRSLRFRATSSYSVGPGHIFCLVAAQSIDAVISAGPALIMNSRLSFTDP